MPDDVRESDLVRWTRQLEPAARASCGGEDASASKNVENLREVVPRDSQSFDDVVHAHALVTGLGEAECGLKRIHGGLREDHGQGCSIAICLLIIRI